MPSSQSASTTETNYPLQNYNISGDIGEIGIFLVAALVILFLGFWVEYMRTDRSANFNTGRLIADLIIVFIVVCLPIVLITFTAFNASNDINVVFVAIAPIFTAGLALEQHANRIIEQARNEAQAQ